MSRAELLRKQGRNRAGEPRNTAGEPRSKAGVHRSRAGEPRSRGGEPRSLAGKTTSRAGETRSTAGEPRSRRGQPRTIPGELRNASRMDGFWITTGSETGEKLRKRGAEVFLTWEVCFASPERSIDWNFMIFCLCDTSYISLARQTLPKSQKIRCGFKSGVQVDRDGRRFCDFLWSW